MSKINPQTRSERLLVFTCLLVSVSFGTGCPRGGGAIRGGSAPVIPVRGVPLGLAVSPRTLGPRSTGRSSRNTARRGALDSVTGVESLRTKLGLSPRASINLRQDGVINAVGRGSRGRSIARVNPDGQIWLLNRRGRAVRLIGRIQSDGTIWETNVRGEAHRMIGSIRVTIRGSAVRIVYEPGLLSDVIGQLKAGDVVKVIGHAPGWYFVERTDGVIGWVAAPDVNAKLDWDVHTEDATVTQKPISESWPLTPDFTPVPTVTNPFEQGNSLRRMPEPIMSPRNRLDDGWWEQEQQRRREQERQEAEDRMRHQQEMDRQLRQDRIDEMRRTIQTIINNVRRRP
jgi:hypothetical protein